MWLVTLLAIVLSVAQIKVGDNLDNEFIFPAAHGLNNNFIADLSWTLGSTQKIQWTTTLDLYRISLFQQDINASSGNELMTIYRVQNGGTGQQSFSWQVQTAGSSLSFSPVYFLWLNPGDPLGFTSHYFNITNRARSSSSSSPSSPISSSSNSSTAFLSSTSSTKSVIASSASATPSQKSPDTTPTSPAIASSSAATVKVGFGVGLGIGIPLVLIAGIWIGLKLVKQRQSLSRGPSSNVPLSYIADNKFLSKSYLPPSGSKQYEDRIHEASGRNPERHELSGERELIELGT